MPGIFFDLDKLKSKPDDEIVRYIKAAAIEHTYLADKLASIGQGTDESLAIYRSELGDMGFLSAVLLSVVLSSISLFSPDFRRHDIARLRHVAEVLGLEFRTVKKLVTYNSRILSVLVSSETS